MRFSDFFNQVILQEAIFRKSKYVEHLADFPMFSIFISKEILDKPNTPYNMEFFNDIKDEIAETCADARNQITKIGFPKMHVNVVIKELENKHAGLAYHSRKYIVIDLKRLLRFDIISARILVHEWAHTWMFNNSKQFKLAVNAFYGDLTWQGVKQLDKKIIGDYFPPSQTTKKITNALKYGDFTGSDGQNGNIRVFLRDINNWPNEYGMSNNHELWATAIEHFFKLPAEHRKSIIKLMEQNR
jgi:hypothetical protein